MQASGGRSTRRARLRNALRHTHKQRGGAQWAPSFSVSPRDPLKVRRDAWLEEVGANPDISGLFPSLLIPNRAGSVTGSGIVQAQRKEKDLTTYFNCMAHQDKLFRAALNIIRKKVASTIGVSVEDLSGRNITSRADVIDALKTTDTTLLEYLRDVERMVMFKADDTGSAPKLRTMYTDNTYCSLSTLLLFPARVENVFIMALSEIMCNLIEDDTLLKEVSTNSLQLILATQYDSYAQALAHTLTAFPLRDGFFLNQSLEEISQISLNEDALRLVKAKLETEPIQTGALDRFKRQETFWKMFVKSAQAVIDISDETKLFRNKSADISCSNYIVDNTYADLTADMLAYAILKKDNIDKMDILGFLIYVCAVNMGAFHDRTMIPEAIYDDVHIHGVPFKNILSNVDITTLEYLLHLEVAIKECWKQRHPNP